MGIKSQVYIRKLKDYLGVDNLGNLSDEQMEKLNKFIEDHPDAGVLGELLIEIGGKGPASKSIVENLQRTLKQVIDAGVEDVARLQEIIDQTMNKLDKENLSAEDRKLIGDLLREFAQILREKMLRNDQLRLAIAGGAFLTVILIAGGFMWYKYKIDCLKIQAIASAGDTRLLPLGK